MLPLETEFYACLALVSTSTPRALRARLSCDKCLGCLHSTSPWKFHCPLSLCQWSCTLPVAMPVYTCVHLRGLQGQDVTYVAAVAQLVCLLQCGSEFAQQLGVAWSVSATPFTCF
jgi:hypothetical protein